MKEELVIEAVIDNLDEVNLFVHKSIEQFEVSKRTLMQLDLVVEEIFVNIASYAYSPNTGSVKILLQTDMEHLYISLTFIDSGVPYNPLEQSDPNVNLSAEERDIGGLGIFLTKNLVDDISYQHINGQNVLKFTKRLND
ncbi:MAG: ATP-binding protein [Selenomonadaceae bacterium]|nr:ATP-binding protein [Selenomonadaceae bacterium]